MIKINFALRKQPLALVTDKAGKSKSKSELSENIKDIPTKKIITAILSCLIGNYTLENYKEEVILEHKKSFDKFFNEQGKLKEQLKEAKKLEDLKKSIESDEKTIKTKLEVIKILLSDRGNPPRLLKTISGVIPKEIWLKEIILSEMDSSIKGHSLNIASVSDFMKELSKNTLFSNITLRSTTNAKDDTGAEVASFELGGQKK